jgi:DNA-binding NarL/FixJ family response regulator
MTVSLASSHPGVRKAGQPFGVLLADDHPLALVRIRRALNDVAEFDVVGEAESTARLLDMLLTDTPDVVVIDLGIDAADGLGLVADMRRRWPEVAVVAVSASDDPILIRRTLQAGASACITQRVAASDLVTVLHQVLAGTGFGGLLDEPRTGRHVTTGYGSRGVEFGIARVPRSGG